MEVSEVPVLIVGGGPVALCTSLLLVRHGVPSLLVERHPGTSIHPRARGLNVRTMELLRTWGLEDEVRAAGRALEDARYVIWATSLAGEETKRVAMPSHRRLMDASISPTSYAACSQDNLEPILLARCRSSDAAQIRFNHELLALRQDEAGVDATIRDRSTGEERSVRAAYLVAADGAMSGIRAALAVPLTGAGMIGEWSGIYFRADLGRFVADRPSLLYWIHNADVDGLFVAVNNRDRWVFQTRYDPARGETVRDFTEERCIDLIRQAAGVPDLAIEVLSVLPWTMASQIAESFRIGHVAWRSRGSADDAPTVLSSALREVLGISSGDNGGTDLTD